MISLADFHVHSPSKQRPSTDFLIEDFVKTLLFDSNAKKTSAKQTPTSCYKNKLTQDDIEYFYLDEAPKSTY
ncbi:unnamed protein product [Caenorhabditis brenneri]